MCIVITSFYLILLYINTISLDKSSQIIISLIYLVTLTNLWPIIILKKELFYLTKKRFNF